MSALNSRILIVDDEAPIRALLGEHLQLVGYEVAQAANGVAALKLLAGGEFDLVLTDVRMPGVSGLELLAEIVRPRPGVGVLVLTASAAQTHVLHVILLCAQAHLLTSMSLHVA